MLLSKAPEQLLNRPSSGWGGCQVRSVSFTVDQNHKFASRGFYNLDSIRHAFVFQPLGKDKEHS